ncbi:MAG TPA: ATP12 family protein [Xanthobacteraceae bacterium]|nr:ATP12 family protein [Xanthobacteraceae bacterium]
MRELFEEVFGGPPRDPQEAARQSSRAPLRKRFYKEASVGEADGGGYMLLLDGKAVKTPSRKVLVVPTRELADIMAAEWNAQGEALDPMSMPMTRLGNSVVDGVLGKEQAVADDLAKYFATDLLFYRAGHPESLVARQAAHWDPVLDWARDELGAHFILTEGIMHVQQPEAALAAARAALPDEAWRVAAMHLVTTVTGSALLALALHQGARDAEEVWAAANVDEDWNFETWGADEEAQARRAAAQRDYGAAATVLKLLA